jgi:Arc/MetJ-type ribon-helix-helix transcriptional regulator
LVTQTNRLVALNVRIPRKLKELIGEYVALDGHKDASEFARDALREKIQRDAPELYNRLFRKEGTEHE